MARKSGIWFRAGRGWFTTMHGKQVPLGVDDIANVKAAHGALAKLLREREQQPAPPNQVSTQAQEECAARASENWPAKVEEWLGKKTALKLKAKTLKDYRWNLSKWLERFRDSPRDEVTVEAIVEHSHAFGWGVNQRRHYIRTATGFLKWCGLRYEDIPCPGHQSAGAKSVIAEELHLRAVAIAPGDTKHILGFMWHTGCRPCEACGLVGELVDWKNGTATLREHKTADHGKTRVLYLSAAALAILTAQKERHGATGPLFRTRHNRAYLRTGLTATLVRLSEKLGARITAYGYRHTYATRALELGLPDVQVAALLGHASTKMLFSHYSHLTQNARLLKEAAARV